MKTIGEILVFMSLLWLIVVIRTSAAMTIWGSFATTRDRVPLFLLLLGLAMIVLGILSTFWRWILNKDKHLCTKDHAAPKTSTLANALIRIGTTWLVLSVLCFFVSIPWGAALAANTAMGGLEALPAVFLAWGALCVAGVSCALMLLGGIIRTWKSLMTGTPRKEPDSTEPK